MVKHVLFIVKLSGSYTILCFAEKIYLRRNIAGMIMRQCSHVRIFNDEEITANEFPFCFGSSPIKLMKSHKR